MAMHSNNFRKTLNMENFTEKLKGFQRKYLRGLAHGMKPVIFIGQKGITDSVVNAVEDALDAHELIKVKLGAGDREEKKSILGEIISNSKAELIQSIGHVAVLFRRNHKKPKIELPRTKE